MVLSPKPPDTWRHGSTPRSTTREVFQAPPKEYDALPAWDALDRHVLRFYGFFKEAVVETNLENYRVRKCVIYYYLEDDTCHIIEPRVDNSGIPQGNLIRRHRFPAADGGYIKTEDLKVGGDLSVYGKTIRLVDCDAFTREYFHSIGLEQPAAMEIEIDPWQETRNDMKVKVAGQERTYEKLYREVMLGGGHVNENMQQFMENDRRVCRFFAVLDDLGTPQYERRPFTILFFLADNTVEIREQYPLNCGRDNFPIFFRRGKLTKAVKAVGPQDQLPKTDDLVQIKDLYVGAEVDLLKSPFFIYDADDFTRQYYKDALGQELEAKMEVRLPERSVPRPPTPPYTGYGSWDDSMSSVLHLIPKVPRKDFHKLFNNDGKILRFTGKYVDPKPEDVSRRFVFNFHVFDDTLSIHEPPQRNLGIVTGKFLEKGVHLNQKTGKLFEPADLMPGNTIKIFNHEFEILDMDEYTRKVITQDPNADPPVDLTAVHEKVRESMRQQFPLVRDIFRRFDTSHNGVITLQEFKQSLQKFGFQLSEPEVLIIMRHFDRRQDGQVSYNEFCDALLDEDVTSQMMQSKPALNTEADADYADRVYTKSFERAESEKIRKAVREIGDVFYKHTGMAQKVFKEFTHMTHLNYVNSEQVHAALLKIGFSFDIEDVQRCILFVIPDASLEEIDYIHFVKSLIACYHDMCAIR